MRTEAEIGVMQPWNHWELAEAGSSLLQSRGAGEALPTPLHFGLLATRTEREYISVVLKNRVCNNVLWESKGTHVGHVSAATAQAECCEGPYPMGCLTRAPPGLHLGSRRGGNLEGQICYIRLTKTPG